ncbi:MAG: glycosyltransferase [Patescibacteria group bacterium]
MKVALVHDHLAQDGGAERVVRVFQRMFPGAPLFTLVYRPDRAHPDFRGTDIRTSFLQRWPLATRLYQWYLPLMPTAVERFDLRGYDLVLSSSASFAKGVITDPATLHACYLHSPTRYLWNDTVSYVNELRYARLLRSIAPLYLNRIRMWDRLAADRVDDFIVNSRLVQQRLWKYYHRQGTIIHPPVNVERFTLSDRPGTYYLAGGRLVSYKRFDLAVEAFNHLRLPLKIYGDGPAEPQLRAMAKPNIEFLGRVPDRQLQELYRGAIAFINPQQEDFGITMVEAMAVGRPVIAYASGGALETVKPNITGALFQDHDWEALADTVIRFKPEQYQPRTIRAWAETFGVDRFIQQLRTHLDRTYAAYQQRLHSLS